MYRRLARQLTPMILLGVAALAPSVASAQEVAVAPSIPSDPVARMDRTSAPDGGGAPYC